MLKASRIKFGPNYSIIENEIPIAELKVTGWSKKTAEMWFNGYNYKYTASGAPHIGYNLEENGYVKATADDSVYEEYPGTVLEYNGIQYLIQQEYIHWLKSFQVFSLRILTLGIYPRYDYSKRSPIVISKNNKQIGSIRSNPKFRKETIIDLPKNWPFDLKIFVFWIVRDNC